MKKPIRISIPTPCHERWKDMAPAEKGRFCASCQKSVIDFTNASDREIAAAYKQDKKLCGRFRESQLNRELVVPREKNTMWMAACASVLAFLGFGPNEALAQNATAKPKTEVTPAKPVKKRAASTTTILAKGIVKDEDGNPVRAAIINKSNFEEAHTDDRGAFSIPAAIGDRIEIKANGAVLNLMFDGKNLEEVIVEKPKSSEPMIMGGMG